MFRFALLLAVSTWMCLGGSCALTCHCLNGETCNPVDGSCTAGCEKGWYGPGCQIGNIALNKPALQSSTYGQYTADNAVNGITPSQGDYTTWNCSHTAETTTGFLWWYVTLSESEDFVIKNVTIVNRQGMNRYYLRNFYILYTSNMIAPPDPTLWAQCAFRSSYQDSTVTTYTCENRTAIGRRVAVYLIAGSQLNSVDKLTLCEVYVDGYSYNATSSLQLNNTYVTTGCDNFQLNFTALLLVPPTYLVVQLVNNATGNVTLIERIQNNRSGFVSVTVNAMANRTYTVFVAPETCCIGSRCLESGMLDNSKCVIGQSTPLPLVTTPLYRQYELRKTGSIVNISTVNNNTCSSIDERITCSQSPDGKSLPESCSHSGSCQLDARYNYTCVLDLSFSDGFVQTSTKNFHISTADFSKFVISETVTCNSITLVMENVTAWWDLEPTLIEFYLSSMATNDTKVMRIPAKTTGKISATFFVMSNSSYSVWAVPVTYWGITQSTTFLNGSCMDSRDCIVGEQTPVKVITTLQRQYILKTEGCCASFAEVSSEQCESPVSHNITCIGNRNNTYEVLTSVSASFCGLKPNVNYTCYYYVYVSNGTYDSHILFSEIECSSRDSVKDRQSPSAAIGGAVTGLVVLIAVVTLVVIFQRRRKILKNEKASSTLSSAGKNDTDLTRARANLGAPDDAAYENTVGMCIEEFESHSRNETDIFDKFSEQRNNEGHPRAVGLQNIHKNRLKNLVPYNKDRVFNANTHQTSMHPLPSAVSDGPSLSTDASISYINGTENCPMERAVAEENLYSANDSSLPKQYCQYESLNVSKDSVNDAEYAVLS